MAGDMRGGGCMVGGVHGGGWGMCGRGACMAGGVVCVAEGHAWLGGRGILRDVVNERAVRILLECILVVN